MMDTLTRARDMSRHAVYTTIAVAVLSLAVSGSVVQAQDKPSAQELADLRARAEAGEAQVVHPRGDVRRRSGGARGWWPTTPPALPPSAAPWRATCSGSQLTVVSGTPGAVQAREEGLKMEGAGSRIVGASGSDPLAWRLRSAVTQG